MSYTPELNTIKANQTDHNRYNRYPSYAYPLGAHVPHKPVQITTVTFMFEMCGTKNNGQIRGLYKDTPCWTPDHHQTTMSSPTKSISDSKKESIKNSSEFKAFKNMEGYPRSSDDIIREMAERQRKREKKENGASDVEVKKEKTESVVSHHKEEARKERKKATTSQETDKKQKKRKKEENQSEKNEEKILRLKYKNNQLFNQLEAERKKNKKLEEDYEALMEETNETNPKLVRIVVHGEEGQSWNEFKFRSFEKQHPAFLRYIENRIKDGERKTTIDMTDKEGEVREMFDVFKEEESEKSDKELASELIETLEDEIDYRGCGYEWWQEGIYYTIEMDFSGFGY